MLKSKKYKVVCLFLILLMVFMLGKLGYSSYQIDKAQRFVADFQNPYSQSVKKYTIEKLKDDIVFVQLGNVSSIVCHKLTKAYFPYPHRFYVNNKYAFVDEAEELCYQDDTVRMVLQFSLNKWSYAHRLECEHDEDCRKGSCRIGVCDKTVLNSDSKDF